MATGTSAVWKTFGLTPGHSWYISAKKERLKCREMVLDTKMALACLGTCCAVALKPSYVCVYYASMYFSHVLGTLFVCSVNSLFYPDLPWAALTIMAHGFIYRAPNETFKEISGSVKSKIFEDFPEKLSLMHLIHAYHLISVELMK